MAMSDPAAPYRTMTREDFDAIVTGELTHQAVWLEIELETAIENCFAVPQAARESFRRLMLKRDGMTFLNKIELVRSIVDEGQFEQSYKTAWKKAFTEIDEIRRIRNAMAHGQDIGGSGLEIRIGYINRSGKEVEITVTPDNHVKLLDKADKLRAEVKALAAKIRAP
jgi:hypothetical protein